MRPAFVTALHRAAAKGRVGLALDGLDRLEDLDGASDLVWLPLEVPANVRLVLSTLPGRALDALAQRGWPVLRVASLTAAECEAVIAGCLAQYRRKLPTGEAKRIAAQPRCSNPLYLRTLIGELRLHGERETLSGRITYYLQAATPRELYGRILARYEQDYQRDRPGLVRDALTALWASRRGLTEQEILALLGGASPLPRAVWAPLSLALDSGLISRSGLLGFGHDYLLQAVQERYLSDITDRQAARLHLADFFASREPGQRTFDELPWLLSKSGQWPRLRKVLADLPTLRNLSRNDTLSYWAELERHVKGGVKIDHCGGGKIGHFLVSWGWFG